VLPPSDARKFERDLPHCERVAMIAGGGHCPQLLQTEAVVEELASFLSP
jgi:pimeloyl-ACP methyl ester carboxylesterase